MTIGPADRINVSVPQLLGDDNERRAIRDELTGIGVSQSVKAELVREPGAQNRCLESVPIVGEPRSTVLSQQ